MLVFVRGFRLENRVLLRGDFRIELPHDRWIDPISTLKHSSRVVGIITPTQIHMPVRRARRRAARFQYMNLVKVAGYDLTRFSFYLPLEVLDKQGQRHEA